MIGLQTSTMKKTVLCLALILSLGLPAFTSQDAESKEKSTNEKKAEWLAFPVLFYTPETKIAFGVGGMVSFRPSSGTKDIRPSSLGSFLIYTMNKQFRINVFPDFYLKDETYHIFGALSFNKFIDKFYGIGSQTVKEDEEIYSSRSTVFSVDVQRKVKSRLNVGIRYELNKTRLTEVEEGGRLALGNILGTEPGTASGLGLSLNWDSRNNIYTPSRGGFYQSTLTFFRKAFGSDYSFTQAIVDLRTYFSPLQRHVLALQAHGSLMAGDVPFYKLSLIGGPSLLRGYWQGRYRDKNMLVFQMEYRLPLWSRLGLAGFVGFGDIAAETGQFRLGSFKSSAGFGLRYLFNREEGITARMDVGFSQDSVGFYFSVNEAF